MKKSPTTRTSEMSADEYAGFLRLLLTPGTRVPSMTNEVEAYLRYSNQHEPLPLDVRRRIENPSRRAA